MITALNGRIFVLKRQQHRCFVRQNPECTHWLAAGDGDFADANPGHGWVRNSRAQPLGPLTTAAVTRNAGEPEMTKVTSTAEIENSEKFRSSSEKRVPQPLGITRKLPWHRRGPEEVGGALAPE